MPQVVRVQVILNPAVNTRIQNMNTWHVVTVGATTPSAAAAAFLDDLDDFYQACDSFFGLFLSGSAPLARCFDLSDPKPRQPILEETLTVLTTASTQIPSEIACCMSYKGTYLSGVSPKRKRGRIYLGPLGANSLDTGAGTFSSTFRAAMASAADSLLTASSGSSEYRWVVYSPTTDTAGEGNNLDSWDAVVEGWVDDNPDVLRSRGQPGGTRSLFS